MVLARGVPDCMARGHNGSTTITITAIYKKKQKKKGKLPQCDKTADTCGFYVTPPDKKAEKRH